MKTLIAFVTGYGTAEKCAHMLAKDLGNTEVVNLKKNPKINLAEYDTVIIGGSIHAGTLDKKVTGFAQKNEVTLVTKKLGLYICCLDEDDKAMEYLKTNFSEKIFDAAKAKGIFGGEVIYENYNFLVKMLMKGITKSEANIYKLKEDNIKAFAKTMA